MLKIEAAHKMFKKVCPLTISFNETHPEARPEDFDDDSGKPRSGTDIKKQARRGGKEGDQQH